MLPIIQNFEELNALPENQREDALKGITFPSGIWYYEDYDPIEIVVLDSMHAVYR